MAFTVERIPENDKYKPDMKKLKAINFLFQNEQPTRWAADRERDIYLFDVGGRSEEGREDLRYFVINVQGKIITFDTVTHWTGNKSVGAVVSVKVYSLRIPPELETRREEIKQLIQEGLDAWGLFGNRSYMKSMTVAFVEGRA